MNTFNQIKIEGFRRLLSVEIPMRPLTVMIGANGVGKTSFLEIFSLLAASAKEQLQAKISELSGLNQILTVDQTEQLKLSLQMPVSDQEPLQYSLQISAKGQFYEITQEQLHQQKNSDNNRQFKYIDSHYLDIKYFSPDDRKLLSPSWEHNLLETSLSQVPKMYKEPENLRKTLASCSFYRSWDLNFAPRSPIRLPQAMRPAKLPGSKGEDLVSCLYYLRETDPDQFELIEDTLASAFPGFERLNFPPVAAGTLAMTWKDENFSDPLYVDQLSEGTLRFLWLITLLYSKDLTAVTLIDEPEVSLHPELLKFLVDIMREASQRTQLIVATHSDRLIRFLNPNEVLVCDIEEGLTTMKWADSLNLDKWLADYTLDELWSMNIFGGRP